MMRDSPHVVAFNRLTMWKRSEEEQPICNDSVSMAERLREYSTRESKAAHMKLEPPSIKRLLVGFHSRWVCLCVRNWEPDSAVFGTTQRSTIVFPITHVIGQVIAV
jgi:hypothetical protein